MKEDHVSDLHLGFKSYWIYVYAYLTCADPKAGMGGSTDPSEKSQVAIGFLRNTATPPPPPREAVGPL